jgi:hypothetical protein
MDYIIRGIIVVLFEELFDIYSISFVLVLSMNGVMSYQEVMILFLNQ